MKKEKTVETQEIGIVATGNESTPKVDTDSWNNRLRSVTMALEKKIPKVGWLVSLLTAAIWPKTNKSIWELVREQVTELVDRKILEQELRERAAQILALQTSLEEYEVAKLNEKSHILTVALSQAEQLYQNFSTSGNAIHLIPLAVITAEINLVLLRERYYHGVELYGEDNRQVWGGDTKKKYDQYKRFFSANYTKWCSWRMNQITIECGVTHNHSLLGDAIGKVNDKLTGETIASYRHENCTIKDYYLSKCEASKQRFYNEKHAEMAGNLATTFLFNKYLPDSEQSAPDVMEALKTIPMGPYFWEGSRGGSISKAEKKDKPGTVKSIHIREYNSVDMMQVKYQDHDGIVAGNPKGGQPHDFKLAKNTHITGLKLGFGYDVTIIISTEVFFSDGSTSGKLGNRSRWPENFMEALTDPSYALHAVNYSEGSGPSNTKGISLMSLDFIHSSLLPS